MDTTFCSFIKKWCFLPRCYTVYYKGGYKWLPVAMLEGRQIHKHDL